MSNTITITSKETYIAWRAEWRAEYAEQSQKIRTLRRELNEAFREDRATGSMHFRLRQAREKACEMMQERAEAKVIAQEQYAQAQAAKQAA
jgi:uncharacterized coiled-coil DUF342 family protein